MFHYVNIHYVFLTWYSFWESAPDHGVHGLQGIESSVPPTQYSIVDSNISYLATSSWPDTSSSRWSPAHAEHLCRYSHLTGMGEPGTALHSALLLALLLVG